MLAAIASCLLVFASLLALYIYFNDRKITCLPADYESLTTKTRCTPDQVWATAARLASNAPLSIDDQLPPKTGRRYIIVGGGGFVGGWIATQLLDRGEAPAHIRLLDIHPPPSSVLQAALAKGVQFIRVDISDAYAVHAAFSSPWPADVSSSASELTVFHTAANIRFYERFPWQLPLSTKVNVDGTRNVIEAAIRVGASILVYTSSGSIGIRSNRFLLWPWERSPKFFVQVIRDEDQEREKERQHGDFFSNYAVSKGMAEELVRKADGRTTGASAGHTQQVLRTGCIRPGNGVFGPRGDMLCGAYVARKTNPMWIQGIISSYCYVENCALAHLLYEQRLISLSASPGSYPDIGGQAFNICDPGPTPTNGDVFTTLNTLTSGECHFPHLPPTLMLLLAHLIEWYYTLPSFLFTHFKLPRITGNLSNLQPSVFSLVQIHLVFDDSRARLPPEKGGLGYCGKWTTLEGAHKTVEEHYKRLGDASVRADITGISLDFKLGLGWGKARKAKTAALSATMKENSPKKGTTNVVNGMVPVEVNSIQ